VSLHKEKVCNKNIANMATFHDPLTKELYQLFLQMYVDMEIPFLNAK